MSTAPQRGVVPPPARARSGPHARAWRGLAVTAVLAACQPQQPAPRALEMLLPTEVATLDPRFATRGLDVKATRLVHAGLVRLDADTLEPVPAAAEGWRWRDARTLEVTLRAGVRFHSGAPLTPVDVCATVAAVRDPALGSPHRAVVRALARCEPTGPRTLVLTLGEARATLLTDLELPVLRADQAALPPRPAGDLDGLGPWSVARTAPGVIELAPATTGLDPTPRHALTLRTLRDENARALRLLGGRADVAHAAFSPTLLLALEEGGLTVAARPGANLTYLLVHNERPPLDRVEVRRALGRALDREALARTLFAGRAQAARTLFPPGHWATPAALPGEPFDPLGAAAVLRGLPEQELLVSTDRARLVLGRALAQFLGDAGLPVRVVPLELGALLERLDRGDYALALLQFPELTEPNVLRWFFHPAGVPGEGGEGKNRARFRHPEAARLLDAASATADRDERQRHYAAFLALAAREVPVVPLFHEDQVAVVSARAASFRPSAEGRWLGLAAVP